MKNYTFGDRTKKTVTLVGSILIILGIFFGGLFLGRNQFPKCKPVDRTELDSIVKANNIEKDSLRSVISKMTTQNETLDTKLDSVGESYANSRNTKFKSNVKDSLERRLIKKGADDFGNIGINSDSETALSYGNQYADYYEIQKRRIANQKVTETAYAGIVRSQEVIIESQGEVIKQFYDRKDKVKTKVGWFVAGYIAGILTPG